MDTEESRVLRGDFNRFSYSALAGGSAVRKEEEAWDIDLEETKRRVRQRRWEKHIHEGAVEREFLHRRNLGRLFSPGEAAAVALMTLLLLSACVFYLTGMSREHSSAAAVQKKTNEYVTLLEDNNAMSSKLEGSIDHEKILRYVTEELGMHYPRRDQVLEFGRSDEMKLLDYEKIPVK